jgi:hypothetical protein
MTREPCYGQKSTVPHYYPGLHILMSYVPR